MASHGTVKSEMLVKTGKSVVKFWKYNGYAVPIEDLNEVHGVELHTQYDGVLYAPRHIFFKHGIPNNFKGEKQLILPVEYWEHLRRNY